MISKTIDSGVLARCPAALQEHQGRVSDMAFSATESNIKAYGSDPLVALFHDVVEDGYATWEEMEAAFPPKVIAALKLLTHDRAMSYAEYIAGIVKSGNQLAMRVKVLDLLDHFSPYHSSTFPAHKLDRYLDALRRLTLALHGIEP